MIFQQVYACGNKRSENGDGENGSKIFGGAERVEIAWFKYLGAFCMNQAQMVQNVAEM